MNKFEKTQKYMLLEYYQELLDRTSELNNRVYLKKQITELKKELKIM